MRKLLSIPAILAMAAAVQVSHAQSIRGAIATEDCTGYGSNMLGRMSKGTVEIKAGEIFAIGPVSTFTSSKLYAYTIDGFQKPVTNNGFLRVHHLKDPNSGTPNVIWVPEKSVQFFESKTTDYDFRPYTMTTDIYSYGKRTGWKTEFVQAALQAAPENLKEKMAWTESVPGVSPSTSSPAASPAAPVASNNTTSSTQTQPNRPLTIADLKGGPGRYVLSSMGVIWKDGKIYNAGANSIFVSGDNVYIAGITGYGSNQRATLWTNGTPKELDTVTSNATVVHVHGDDVYVAGTRGGGDAQRPVLWKNGALVETLSESRGDRSWTPTHISVYNNEVCVAGFFGLYERKHMLWKSGKDSSLDTPYTSGMTDVHRSMNLSDNDVYIAIVRGDASAYDASGAPKKGGLYLIKNGQPQHIADVVFRGDFGEGFGNTEDEMIHIYVSDKNAYIVSTINGKAKLWKNNAEQKLEGFEDPETLQEMNTEALRVFATGDNVYVFGARAKKGARESNFVIWKNGKAEIITNGPFPGDYNSSMIKSFFVVE